MTVDSFFHSKGVDHLSILQQAHQILENCHPGVQSTIKYGVPVYTLKKNLVYLDIQRGKPLMGVMYGIHLVEIHSLLDFTGRKQVGHFSLENMDEKRFDDLLIVLASATEFDLNKDSK